MNFVLNNDVLYIIPEPEDLENFSNQFTKESYSGGFKAFKKNSKINKAWLQFLEDKRLVILNSPDISIYFNNQDLGKYKSRLFKYKEIVYYTMITENDFEIPIGFKEIESSEFYKVIEDSRKGIN